MSTSRKAMKSVKLNALSFGRLELHCLVARILTSFWSPRPVRHHLGLTWFAAIGFSGSVESTGNATDADRQGECALCSRRLEGGFWRQTLPPRYLVGYGACDDC